MAKRFEKAKEYNKKYGHLLSECPSCRSKKVEIQSERTIFQPRDAWSISCTNCGDCVYGRTSVREAIKTWNDRAKRLREAANA